MKTYCKRLNVDRELVKNACEAWKMRDSGRKNKWRIEAEFDSEDAFVDEITSDILSRSLSFSAIKTKKRVDGCNGKIREIGIEPIKQQVCGYIMELALADFLNAKIGFWQVSSNGKGQFAAAKAASKWLENCEYFAHCDFEKCYDSIACDVVMRILKRYVKSDDLLYIAESILNTYPDGHLMIGSFFSMRMAALVMSFGYHFVEQQHVIRRGKLIKMAEHQAWYVDDVFLFAKSKKNLKTVIRRLESYMLAEFGLRLKPWKVCRKRGGEPVDIAGCVVRKNRLSIRGKIFKRARRALFRFRAKAKSLSLAHRVVSYYGWLENTDSLKFIKDNGIRAVAKKARAVISLHARKAATCR